MLVKAKDWVKDKITGVYSILVNKENDQEKQTKTKTSKLNKGKREKRTKETQETQWLTEWENNQVKNSNRLGVPSHFNKYTVAI